MDIIKKIELSELYHDKLDDNNYRKLYSINLKNKKHYFFELVSDEINEFNMRIYDKDLNMLKIDNDEEIDDDSNIINFNSFEDETKEEEEKEEPKKIEVIIEFSNFGKNDEKMNFIDIPEVPVTKLKKKRDFNNKVYFKPSEDDEYIISITSDYEGEEGEFSLIVKQVEDISKSFNKTIELNNSKKILFKTKFDSIKFNINLKKSKKYSIETESKDIKIFVFDSNNNIINNYENNFKIEEDGEYVLEIMSLKNNNELSFFINEETLEEKIVTHEEIITRKIILLDEKGEKFSLFIKNEELKIKKVE